MTSITFYTAHTEKGRYTLISIIYLSSFVESGIQQWGLGLGCPWLSNLSFFGTYVLSFTIVSWQVSCSVRYFMNFCGRCRREDFVNCQNNYCFFIIVQPCTMSSHCVCSFSILFLSLALLMNLVFPSCIYVFCLK